VSQFYASVDTARARGDPPLPHARTGRARLPMHGLRVSQLPSPGVPAVRGGAHGGVDGAAGGAVVAGALFFGDLHGAAGVAAGLCAAPGADARGTVPRERGELAAGGGGAAVARRGAGLCRRAAHVGAAVAASSARALHRARRRAQSRREKVGARAATRLAVAGGEAGRGVPCADGNGAGGGGSRGARGRAGRDVARTLGRALPARPARARPRCGIWRGMSHAPRSATSASSAPRTRR
jgi:hypothetical protein